MVSWPLFATRRASQHPVTGAAGLDSRIAPRNAPQVAPGRAPGVAPQRALQPQATPEVAPKLAARQARGGPPQEVQKVAPGERAQTAAEPVTYLNMEDCEALGWTDDPSRGRKNVRRIMDGQCCRPISARDHACELLAWLRAHPLLVDQLVPATDLAVFYRGYCRSINLKELPWQPVATQLNRLPGGRRLYRWVDGRKLRVYHIPPVNLETPDGTASP